MSLFPVDEPALRTFLEGHAGDPKCDRCTFISGSSTRASSLLFPHNNVHRVGALTGTRSSSRADVQVDYLRVEMELQEVETDRQ